MKSYNEYSDRYLLSLIPFFVISVFIHVLLLGGGIAYASLTISGEGVSITSFAAPSGSDSTDRKTGTPGGEEEDLKKVRQKIYRVDYFSKLLVEKIVKSSDKPIAKPKIVKKPIESIKPIEKVEKAIPSVPIEPASNEKEMGKVFIGSELTKQGEVLYFPPYQFTLIPYNEGNWLYFPSHKCIGYLIVYFVVDITKRDGFEEYFEWVNFFDYLFSIQGVKSPPTPIGIAEIIEDPYTLTPELWADAIRRRLESEELKLPIYKKFNFIDVQGQILPELQITELPRPQVYFVDDAGAVRMKLEGRIGDIKLDEVRKALSIIKDMWGMTDIEAALAVAAILSYQQKLNDEDK